MIDRLNKLCKWRSVLAGWQVGTKSMTSEGTPALRDQMEKWLIMRAENSALASLLLKKGVFTAEELTAEIQAEAETLDKALERHFPGFRTTEAGLEINAAVAAETMRHLRFPP